MSEYQSRYVAYARAHGKTPEEMLDADREAWPGGLMTGYMLWVQGKWREWRKATGYKDEVLTEKAHADFDGWLAAGPEAPDRKERGARPPEPTTENQTKE